MPAYQQDDRFQNGEDEECHPDGSESGGEVHDEGADGRSGHGGNDNGQIAHDVFSWRLTTQGRCQRKPQAPCVMIISFLLRQSTPRDRRKRDIAFRKVADMKGVFTLRVSPQPSPRASTSPPPPRDGFFEVSSRR